MLNNFEIEDFRGIKNLKIDDFGQVNVIVGENGCGKTNLLEALFLSTDHQKSRFVDNQILRNRLFLGAMHNFFLEQDCSLFIDEIENGLHWKTQKALWKFLFEAAKEKNIQIFATTHSNDSIKAFVETSLNYEMEIRLFRLTKNGEKIESKKYDNQLLKAWFDENKTLETDFWEIR